MKTDTTYLENDAVISSCGRYRYLLRRVWDHKKPRALLCMLNPSTADAKQGDPTIRSCVRLLSALGYGSFEVVNVFGHRATNPKELGHTHDYVGEANDNVIKSASKRCDVVVCAWGAHPLAHDREFYLKTALGSGKPALYCFGKTKSGAPKHPLYIKTGTPLEIYA